MNLPFVGYVGILLAVGVSILADGVTTAATIMTIINASNSIAIFFAIAGAIIIAAFAVATRAIFISGQWFAVVLWLVAITIDVYTTMIGIIHFVIERKGFQESIDLALQIQNLPSDYSTAIVIGLTILISGSTLSASFMIE